VAAGPLVSREEVGSVSPDPLGTPDADPRVTFGDGYFCAECDGLGVAVSAVHLGGALWTVTWLTTHGPGCVGRSWPERAYLVDVDALAAGDRNLPGLPERPAEWPKCAAVASTTGKQCRKRAGLYGLCSVHGEPRP
jgi:hypothetical protein